MKEAIILQEHPGVFMSKLYPPIHLLRLLTRLPNLLATSNLDPQALGTLIATLAHLVPVYTFYYLII